MKKLFCLVSMLLVSLVLAGENYKVEEFTYVGTNGNLSITNKNYARVPVRFSELAVNFNIAVGTNFDCLITSSSGLTNYAFRAFSNSNRLYYVSATTPWLTYDDVVRYAFGTNRDPAQPYTNLFRYTVEW